jgi:hypothetical protein
MSLKSAVQSKKPRLNKLKTEAIEEVKEDVMQESLKLSKLKHHKMIEK